MIIENNANRKLILNSDAPTEAEIEQLMRENGIKRFNFDEAYGEGADLWTDEEFEEFLTSVYESRRENREETSKFD